MKWTLWFVTYNGMGGHPVLSLAPDVLFAADSKSFGDAVTEIEICAHVEPKSDSPPESDILMARCRDRLPTLPKAWLRRKKRRVEIAYHSHVGCAEDLLDGDFAVKKVPNAALLRRTCVEVATSLALLKACVKSSDHFDVGRFLGQVDTNLVELNALDDGQLLLRLVDARAAMRARLAR